MQKKVAILVGDEQAKRALLAVFSLYTDLPRSHELVVVEEEWEKALQIAPFLSQMGVEVAVVGLPFNPQETPRAVFSQIRELIRQGSSSIKVVLVGVENVAAGDNFFPISRSLQNLPGAITCLTCL
jgi:hypothetical protein